MKEIEKEEQPKPAKKKFPWGKYFHVFILVPVVIIVVTLAVLSLKWKQTLIVQRVLVDGANHLQATEIVALSGIQPHSILGKLDCRMIEKKLLTHPLIKKAEVISQLPDAMRIRIIEREPFAAINDGQILYVDSDGVLLPRLASIQFDLPLINGIHGIDSTQLGQPLRQKEVEIAINVLKEAQVVGWYHSISEVKVDETGDIVLFAMDSGVPIALGKDRVPEKLVRLQTFWTNFVKNGNAAYLRYVDLRFDGEVVVKWDKRLTGQTTKFQL